MLTCLIGNEIINCYDGTHTKEQLKKWSKKKILSCPACGRPYEYCHGKIKSPYFRHMDKEECTDRYSESETEEHMQGKKDLYEWVKSQPGLTNAVLEAWISETKQRPDIMFEYDNKKYVIEYQCSPIASEYFERHELYNAAGIHDIWICGTEKYLGRNKRLNTLEKCRRLYYDTKSKVIYKMDSMNKKEFLCLLKLEEYRYKIRNGYASKYIISKYKNREVHLMKNIYDYTPGYKNYLLIKDTDNCYICTGSYYPSPTGRPSNKYPYPVRKYRYSNNYSYATYLKLSNTKLILK